MEGFGLSALGIARRANVRSPIKLGTTMRVLKLQSTLSMQKIVLVGGGSGVSELLIELKKAPGVSLSAIVTVFDDGGSTGKIRRNLSIPAVGDLRKVFSASAGKEVFEFMEERNSQGHPAGNLLLAFLVKQDGFEKGVRRYHELIQGVAEIIPVSFSNSQLIGITKNGKKIIGEDRFDHLPKGVSEKDIYEIFLKPKAILNPRAKRLLSEADKIVVGPGSLFGSLLVNFLVSDFTEAFEKSKAEKVLVLNARAKKADVQKRFPVKFDQVLEAPKKTKRWSAKNLILKIIK